jgi:hypothetical protein
MAEGRTRWLLVGGPKGNPVFFCMEMRAGRDVSTLKLERAQTFATQSGARAVLDEWGLDPKHWRIEPEVDYLDYHSETA